MKSGKTPRRKPLKAGPRKLARKPVLPVPVEPVDSPLLNDLRELIQEAREGVARMVDSGLSILSWHVGQRIRQEILREQRADYGASIVATVSRQLEVEYGRGFALKSVRRMVQFAEVFPDIEIVATLSRQLTMSHFILLIPLDKPLQREFYSEMCRIEGWSVRTLRQKIAGMLYERTAVSRKPVDQAAAEIKQLREEDRFTPDLVFRDPYILDFLGLRDTYSEKDLESAILRDMESFLLELGGGFCFVARQQRMQIDDRDYYLDLLFYHRKLRRLIAIDLKMGQFDAADKGQMELYLGWLKAYAKEPDEAEPLGMILCAGKSEEHVALLELERSGIHVASYWTDLPPKEVLERKLHETVRLARVRLAARRRG